MRKPQRAVALTACAVAALALPATSVAGGGGIGTGGGGGDQTTSGTKAKLKANGKAIAPASAPRAVKKAIEAANSIDGAGYRMGGGHSSVTQRDSKYDCSRAVSYVLGPKGAGLVDRPMVSGDFARWGSSGKGNWITTYGDSGHAFVVIAGLRFDTSGGGSRTMSTRYGQAAGTGPRWRTRRSPAGYTRRHAAGL